MIPAKYGKYNHASQIITGYEDGHPKYYQCIMKGLYEAMTSEDGNMSASKLDIIEKISHGAVSAFFLVFFIIFSCIHDFIIYFSKYF